MRNPRFPTADHLHSRTFLLQRAQPALSGLMDGSLSTLAPIFAVVLATHRPLTAFYTGLATALGAGVSMAFSEGLSIPETSRAEADRFSAAPSPAVGPSSAVYFTPFRS